MRLFLALAIGISMIGFAGANPIAIDSTRRPISLVGETVDIAVGGTQSIVSGNYSFRQGKDEFPGERPDHVIIELPVIVHGQQSFDALKSSVAASVRIGNRVFHPTGSSAGSPLRGLPADWKMCFVEFEIPLRAVRPEFTAVIRYTQPHLPGGVSAYYPIEPPASSAVVRYTPAQSVSLKLVSKRVKAVEAESSRITVQPEHNKLILVRATKT
jgi:hypothetical protein